jgi:FlgD Ig-like domain
MKLFMTIFCLFISVILLFPNPTSGYNMQFHINPNTVITNYYDSSISTGNGMAVCQQPNEAGNGCYAVFHSRETAASTLRTYYSYTDADGNITNVAWIGPDDVHETKPALDIDPETGDPIVAWNRNDGVVCSYDLYHLGSPGLWKTPFYIIDENTWTPHPDDDFKDPIVKIGVSPDVSKRRVYILAKNQRVPIAFEGFDIAMLAYADFDVNDFHVQSSLDWNYNFIIDCISLTHISVEYSFDVTDEGFVAIIGYDDEFNVFAYINDNFGEGDFDVQSENFQFPVENPLNQDGTARFIDDQGNPSEIFFAPVHSENTNALFYDDDTKIMMPVNFGLIAEPGVFIGYECLLYPKILYYDIAYNELSFIDLHIEGDDPNDDLPMIPWDLNENGIVDSYDAEGVVEYVPSWPIYYPATTYPEATSLNNYKISHSEDKYLITIFWNDGTKATLAEQGLAGYSNWLGRPEIAMIYSEDGGDSWEQPQYLNSLQNPELSDMILEYSYVADEMEELGYGDYCLKTMFYDDNGYGPSQLFPLPNVGGTIMEATLLFEVGGISYNLYVCDPNSYTIWHLGEDVSIQCAGSNITGPLDYDLMLGWDQFVCSIAEDVNTSPVSWIVPESLEISENYRIRVQSFVPSLYGYSEEFSILNPDNAENVLVVQNELFQNTPNPFNPTTTIAFSLNTEITEDTELVIYNAKGQKVKSFDSAQDDNNGVYSIVWDGTDDSGKPVSSGVYLCKLKAGDFEDSKKMLLLK